MIHLNHIDYQKYHPPIELVLSFDNNKERYFVMASSSLSLTVSISDIYYCFNRTIYFLLVFIYLFLFYSIIFLDKISFLMLSFSILIPKSSLFFQYLALCDVTILSQSYFIIF